MTLFRLNQLGLATVILTVFLGLCSTGEGFKQELWLYTEDSTSLYFHTHVQNLTKYSFILPKFTTRCTTGLWLLSTTVNYQNYYYIRGSWGDMICEAINMTTVKSLRHFAASETSTDAISLYSGDKYDGDEIFVTQGKTDISISIGSLAATGTSNWMLYEGKNFEGKLVCYKVPYSGSELHWDKVNSLNMTTIGLVYKGCDLDEIQLYRESFLL